MTHCPRPSGPLRALVLGVLIALIALIGVNALAAETAIPPKPTRWVTDTAQLLSPTALGTLDQRLEDYDRRTGHQIVVWVGDTIGITPLDDFAVRTFKAWQLGRQGRDDGILVAVLAKDHKIAIEVGYGLEDRVPDATAGQIINDVMAPRLRDGDADGAIQSGVDAILKAVDGSSVAGGERATAPPEKHPNGGRHVLFAVLALLFLILLVTNPSLAMYLLFSIFNGGGGFGGGGGSGGFSGGGGRSGGGGARGSW